MKMRWLLLGLVSLNLTACYKSKTYTYEFKPLVTPTLDPKLTQCLEAEASVVNLTGPFKDEARVKATTNSGEVNFKAYTGDPMAASSEKKVINVGCSPEMAQQESGGLPVVPYDENMGLIAEKVLLCGGAGTGVKNDGTLIVFANTVVMKDYLFVAAGLGQTISINADRLVLQGENRLTVISASSSILPSNAGDLNLTVTDKIDGQGTLEVASKLVTCADGEKDKANKEAEKNKAEQEKLNEELKKIRR